MIEFKLIDSFKPILNIFHNASNGKGFIYTGPDIKNWNLKNGDKLERIDLTGARKSAKTFSFCIALVLILLSPKARTRVAFYRLYSNGAKNSMKEFIEVLEFLNVPKSWYESNIKIKERIINFKFNLKVNEKTYVINNLIHFNSLFTNIKDTKPQLGISRSFNYDNEIIIIDEITELFEYRQDLLDFILDGLGGAKNRILLTACNPWTIKNKHIEDVNNFVPYNEHRVKNEISYGDYKDGRLVVHNQWRVNNFISEADKKRMLLREQTDKKGARVACFGLPGVEDGAIFSGYNAGIEWIDAVANNYEYINNNFDAISFGIDYGMKNDAFVMNATALKSQAQSDYMIEKICMFEEYRIGDANSGPEQLGYNDEMLAEDVINNILRLRKSIKLLQNTIIPIFVDASAIGFIQTLQRKILHKQLDNIINVYQAERWNMKDLGDGQLNGPMKKIQELRRIMVEGCLEIDVNCHWLQSEIETWSFVLNSKKDKPQDKNNHSIDAFIYSICTLFGCITKYNNIIEYR